MKTVAAISTPPGKGGIGIVRMSGEASLQIINELFVSKSKKLKPRYMTFGRIMNEGKAIDEVLVCYYKAPNSYTREDMVEVFCHGGYVSTLYIYELLLKHGATPAEPGEFTKLAFLNGRIDLLEAEAVEGIINSQNRSEQELYTNILGGALSNKLEALLDELLDLIAECEAKIDYPELGDVEDMKRRIESLTASIHELIDDESRTTYVREGIKTAIIGRPNVGKSSLLNALTNKERAIVTEIPGTTRDTIEEYISYDGLYLHLIDTAGIRATDELIEAKGIELSREKAEEADLVIVVIDGAEAINDDDIEILESVRDKNLIVLVNKEDKGLVADKAVLEGYTDRIVIGSVKNDIGVRELMKNIKALFVTEIDSGYASVFNLRHSEALKRAENELKLAYRDVDVMPFEIVEVSLRSALDELNSILGRDSDEDIIDRVFSEFCVGK